MNLYTSQHNVSVQNTTNTNSNPKTILQVSQLNTSAKTLLESQLNNIWVEGEISNLAQPQSGHIYLTLKDNHAQVRGAFFKQAQKSCKLHLQNGQQVLVKAKVSLYAPRGDYQLIISTIQAAGAGQLQQAFEYLKKKLQQDGLFDTQHKKELPLYPAQIGVVTSPSGAALQDIIHVLKRRFPIAQIVIYPTLVQGTSAASQIANMIDFANKKNEVDILLVSRGGGSLEDLWPFNEEIVAQALFRSQIPTISAVGHQTDFTIADFVADIRAPTPSSAAELATPNGTELLDTFLSYEHNLTLTIRRIIKHNTSRVQALSRHVKHPRHQIQEHIQRLDHLSIRLQHSFKQYLLNANQKYHQLSYQLKHNNTQQKITQYQHTLNNVKKSLIRHQIYFLTQKKQHIKQLGLRLTGMGPQKTLERGYAIVHDQNGQVIEKATATKKDQHLQLQFIDHTLDVKVI